MYALGNLRVALEGEDERHVDAPSCGDAVLDGADPGRGAGNLHVQVRSIAEIVESHRLRERGIAVVGEGGVDLQRDVAVDTAGPLPHGLEEIARTLYVVDGQLEEDLLGIVVSLEGRPKLLVVPPARREGFSKMVGLDVTPTTASSSINRSSSPVASIPARASRPRRSRRAPTAGADDSIPHPNVTARPERETPSSLTH